ncbi:hypothetical protein [Streptomyces sp. NBC_01408]|uniref:hypothetical protein n=1 Tax=Streptomyces sp. NBC_01408 TaxID=2903855 RepID=UPI00225BE03A|nr:hypothetical protein [Streptomyces sp. NBC_01408]MCX4696129.1 hypothetical protein [Streptomyces sp. NBC_01408]
MQNIAVEQQRGHVLLIAGDAAVRRRTVQVAPSANLAALGVVPVAMMLNSQIPCDTTYLDGARDPNTVLTRLRTAAATPGPLLVYLSGRLTVDRRSRRLHLCLAGTTAGSVRYTGLPWEWLGSELRGRPAGLTTVLLDLAADKAAWPVLQEYGSLPASPSAEVYGVVSPPGFAGGGDGVSSYTREWINQLRSSPGRPGNLQLHALAVGTAALPPGALVLPTARELGVPGAREAVREPVREPAAAYRTSPAAPAPQAPQAPLAPQVPVPPLPEHAPGQDPRPHIHALATAGRHLEAATLAQAWEAHVLQTYGYTSAEATQWAEIRADLARMAGNFRLATQLWTSVGRSRLAHQPPDAPEVKGAAAGALYCWTQLKDQAAAVEAGPELIRLLRALPSLDPRHLHLARQRLDLLQRARPDAAPRLQAAAELP